MDVPPDPVDDPEDDPEDDPADPYLATKINKCHDLLKLFMCNYMIIYRARANGPAGQVLA